MRRCANPRCPQPDAESTYNCPAHPWALDEVMVLDSLLNGARDMNVAGYYAHAWRVARKFFAAEAGEQ